MADQTAVSSTQSVLSMMTRAIVESKEAATTKLTPTAMETPWPLRDGPVVIGAMFPDDQPTNEIEGSLLRIERELANIRQAMGIVTAAVAAVNEQTMRERAADERAAATDLHTDGEDTLTSEEPPLSPTTTKFVEEFEAKSAAAQAATFTAAEEAGDDWRCPVHKKSVVTTSPRGRVYGKCPTCDEFEK